MRDNRIPTEQAGRMLTGRQIPDTRIFEITYSGALDATLDAAEFEAVRDELIAFLDAHQPADLLAVYGDLELSKIDPKALWDDLRSAGLEKKIRRAALLTDAGWLRTLARAGRHFVRADVKVFPLADRAAALAWLTS